MCSSSHSAPCCCLLVIQQVPFRVGAGLWEISANRLVPPSPSSSQSPRSSFSLIQPALRDPAEGYGEQVGSAPGGSDEPAAGIPAGPGSSGGEGLGGGRAHLQTGKVKTSKRKGGQTGGTGREGGLIIVLFAAANFKKTADLLLQIIKTPDKVFCYYDE